MKREENPQNKYETMAKNVQELISSLPDDKIGKWLVLILIKFYTFCVLLMKSNGNQHKTH